MSHVNRFRASISNTPGTSGALTLSAAQPTYRTLGSGDDGIATDVVITEGTAWEVRTGCVYTHSGTSLARGTLEESSTGSAISFTSAAIVTGTATAAWGNGIQTVIPVNGSQINGYTDAITVPLTSVTYTGSVFVGRDTLMTVTGTTGKTSGVGHFIGLQSGVVMNQSGTVTNDLVIGQEAQVQVPGAGITNTLTALHVTHLKNHAGATVLLTGYRNAYAAGDNTGSITISVDYYAENWTGLAGAPALRYSLKNDDPNKPLFSAGRILKDNLQEVAPAIGAGYVSGRFYSGSMSSGSLAPAALSAGVAYFAPLRVQRRIALSEIGCTVTTLALTSDIQLAIYPINDGVLGTPLYTSGSISSATTGDKTANPAITLEAGNYVVGVNSSGAPQINWAAEYGLTQYFGATTSTGGETTPFAVLSFGTWGTPSLSFANIAQLVPFIWVKGS